MRIRGEYDGDCVGVNIEEMEVRGFGMMVDLMRCETATRAVLYAAR